MRARLHLSILTLAAVALTLVLALAARDAARQLASTPLSAWGPTALTRTLVLLACGAGALGAAWHVLSGALAVIALAGSAPRSPCTGIGLVARRALHRWGAPIVRRAAAGTLVAAVATSAPAMAAQTSGASDDLGWTPTTSAPAPSPTEAAPPPADSDPPGAGPAQQPGAAAGPSGTGTPGASARTHLVESGESLWSITEELLAEPADQAAGAPSGTPPAQTRIAQAWPLLYAANAESIGDDPGLILPGTALNVPEGLLNPPTRS